MTADPPDLPMPARYSCPTMLIAIVLVASACAGCGRRGALQPPDSAVPERSAAGPASPNSLPQGIGLGGGIGAPDPEAVRAGDELAESATPAAVTGVPLQTSKGAKRGYTIPKQPFILDPIL